MTQRIMMLSALLAVLLSATYWYLRPAIPAPPPVAAAQFPAAPDFTWRSFDGSEHHLLDLAGRSVVLHFWASWCAPCRTEFPALLAAARALGDDVVVLAISTDDDKNKAEKFLHEVGGDAPPANLLYAFDPHKKIAYDVFMTALYPESIMLDAQLRMRRKIPGAVDWADPAIRQELRDYAVLPPPH